jgi:hypothetical protein
MHFGFARLRFPAMTLLLASALACGSRSDDPVVDGGTGGAAATSGTSGTGATAGTGGASGGSAGGSGGASGIGATAGSGGASGTGATAGSGGSSGTGATGGNGGSSGTGAAAGSGGSSGSGATGGNGGSSGGGGSSGSSGSSGTDAAGGSGGSSGTGASGGTAGASGAGGTGTGGAAGGTSGDSGACGCVPGRVFWGMDGGHVAYHYTSGLEICSTFIHQRDSVVQDPPLSCQQQLGVCGSGIGAGDVTRAMAHADVQAAIAAAPVIYGEDTRPVDGAVLRIQIQSAVIEVGTPCRAAGCKPIPAGVDALATLLQALTKQELGRAPCSSIFPPLP